MRISLFYIILILLFVFSSCGRRPRYVLPENKMSAVLYDIQVAQAIYNNNSDFKSDEDRDALLNGILKKHGITQSELDSSLFWYSDNIEIYNTINDSVASRLRAASNKMMSAKTSQPNQISSYSVPPHYVLNERTPTLSFSIDSFRIKSIDLPNFNFRFDVQGVSSLHEVEAAVYFRYKDTLIREITPVDKNKYYHFTKPQRPDSLLKSISGYVHVKKGVPGLTPDVILYNMTYIDSLPVSNRSSMPSEAIAIPESRSSGSMSSTRESRRDINPSEKRSLGSESDSVRRN